MRTRSMFRNGVAAGVVLLIFTGTAHASFLSDFIRLRAVKFVEQQEVKNAPDCARSADDALDRAIELLSDGRQAEAEDLIRSAVKSHRDDVRILFAKGVLERSRWRKDSAQVWFAMARKAKGDEALSRAAWLSVKLDQKKSTAEDFQELIRLSDENPDDLFLLWLGAIQCREQSKKDGVSREAKRAMTTLGRVRYELLLEHLRIGPVLLHQTYANILDDLKRYEESLEHRLLAVSLEAKGWSLDGLAFTLYKLQKYEWSSAIYARVLRRNPLRKSYWIRWGNTLTSMERYEEAESKYRSALRLAPEEGQIWYSIAKCLDQLGKDKEGFEAYLIATELGYDKALDNLALCYQFGRGVDKDTSKAFELYRLYVETHPKSTWALYKLGYLSAAGVGGENYSTQAVAYYEEVLQINPNHFDALNALAWQLVTSKDASLHNFPRAIELVKRSITLNENGYNLHTLMVVYFKSGQYEKALDSIEYLIQFHQTKNPEKPISEHLVKQLAKYKQALAESKETL